MRQGTVTIDFETLKRGPFVPAKPYGVLTMAEAPFALFDEDGCLGAIRDLGDMSPQTILREAINEDEFLWEVNWVEVPGSDGAFHRPVFSQYKEVLAGFSLAYWRIAEHDDEMTGDFGSQTYFPCSQDYPTALRYWDLGTVF